jgi:hypothetical protein
MPSVAAQYVALCERVAARLVHPRVRALHLPPPQPASQKDAEFLAVELEDGSIGFSYVAIDGKASPPRSRPDASAVAGADAAALARGYAGNDPVARAVGFAAINALTQQLFGRAGYVPPEAGDSLGELGPAPGEHVGMIGLFPPLIPQVDAARARLTVLELKPELAGEREHYRVTLDPADLATCDKVVSTCTVMLNDTLDAVLAACRDARHFAIVGPTAGCLPDPLFARGVDSIGGRRVVNVAGFRDAFLRGEKWGAFAAKYVIAQRDYPGVERLLDRVD